MKHKKRIAILLAAILILCGGVGIYAADYYRAGEDAVAALAGSDTIAVETDGGMTLFRPDVVRAGLIFYPGGKVEHTAYAPLMEMLASSGVLCVITQMPLNLAVLDMDAAQGIPAQFPEVDTWYIGGHSLGGAMAASYAAQSEDFAGLVLLAAYSTADLTGSELQVLSIYGSNDGVLDREKYAQYRSNLPDDAVEVVIDGGNHALFGDYGVQEGDGEGYLSAFEQQVYTMSAVLDWMGLSEPEEPLYDQEVYRAWVPDGKGDMLRSVLTLTPELGQFVLSEPMYSSFSNVGSYTTEGDVLVCEGSRGTYRFRVTQAGMVYEAEGSEVIYAHGSVLGDTPNAQAQVPDGTVYERK